MKQKYQLCKIGGAFHYVKLTKKHWWSKWEIEKDGDTPRLYMIHGLPASGITWTDIRDIVSIASDLLPEGSLEFILSEFQSEESFYQEILKRFNDKRNGND